MVGWVYLDYSVSSGPFLRFSMRFEFLSEMFDHSVSESRDPSLTISQPKLGQIGQVGGVLKLLGPADSETDTGLEICPRFLGVIGQNQKQ